MASWIQTQHVHRRGPVCLALPLVCFSFNVKLYLYTELYSPGRKNGSNDRKRLLSGHETAKFSSRGSAPHPAGALPRTPLRTHGALA
eukprot:7382258-Prymnesium_polylepis.6